MKTTFLSVHKHEHFNLPSPLSNQVNLTEALKVSFSPGVKLLTASWSKDANTAELRHSVRLLARMVALLRVELVLLDIPSYLVIKEEDRQWTSSFMREALKNTPIRRIARVLPASSEGSRLRHPFTTNSAEVPYQMQLFNNRELARKWLLEGLDGQVAEEEQINIPLNFNLNLIRSEVKRQEKNSKQPDASQDGKQRPLSARLPDQLRINTDFVSILIDKCHSLMTINWLKAPQSRQYRYGMLKAIRAAAENHLELFLLNNQRLGMLTLEDQGWLISTAQRVLTKTKLKRLAIITSADALQQMSSDNIGNKLKQANLPLETRCFLSEEDAREWLFTEELAN